MSLEKPDLSGVTDIPVSRARQDLAAVLRAVTEEDQFVYLTKNGRRVAVIMPADIGENYEKIEDYYWAARAAEARRDMEAGIETAVPWETVIAELEPQPEEAIVR
jgi:prevent-host-death family protein